MQVRVRGLGSHARHARNRLARATPRPTGGDGDGPLADGRTPVECRTSHGIPSTRETFQHFRIVGVLLM